MVTQQPEAQGCCPGDRIGIRVKSGSLPSSTLLLPHCAICTWLGPLRCQPQESRVRTKLRGLGLGGPPLPDAHTEAWSAGTPPTKRSVSRLRPSVPLGLWPTTGVSPSTESVPRRQCRDSSKRCQRPGSTGTELVRTAGPEPVSNLGDGSRDSGQRPQARTTAPPQPPALPPPLPQPPSPPATWAALAPHRSCTRPPSNVSARKSLPRALPLYSSKPWGSSARNSSARRSVW